MSFSLMGVPVAHIIVGNITSVATIVRSALEVNTHSVLLELGIRGKPFSTVLTLEWLVFILGVNCPHVDCQILHQ